MSELEACAFALDVGTLQARVGVVKGGRAEVIADHDGHHSVPAVVGYYADEAPLTGMEALRKKPRALASTLSHLKALLALSSEAAAVVLTREGCTFKTQSARGGSIEVAVPHVDGAERRVKPEDALTLLLTSLVATAAPYLTAAPTLVAALPVPHDLPDAARALLVHAARAVLPAQARVSLVADAQCVVLAHGLDVTTLRSVAPLRVLVVDFGSVLRLSELTVARGLVRVLRAVTVDEVRASALERALVEHWCGEAARKLRVEVGTLLSAARVRAKLSAEYARVVRVLAASGVHECAVAVDALLDGVDFASSLTRAKFEALTDVVWRKVQRAVGAFAHACEGDVARVLLAGGHCKLPRMTAVLSAELGAEVLAGADQVDPLLAVVHGATLHARSVARLGAAAVLAGAGAGVVRRVGALTRAVGVRVAAQGGAAVTLVPRDSALPVLRRVRLRFAEATRTRTLLEVLEGEYYEAETRTAALTADAKVGEAEAEAAGEGEGEAETEGEAEAADASAYERVLARVAVAVGTRSVELTVRVDDKAQLTVRVQCDADVSGAKTLRIAPDAPRTSRTEALEGRAALLSETEAEAEAREQ